MLAINSERRTREAYIRSLTATDLPKLENDLTELQSQKEKLTLNVSDTKQAIRDQKKALYDLESDTLGDIADRVSKCLEAEKSVQLLEMRLNTYATLLADVESRIPLVERDITELQAHLEAEEHTKAIEEFLEAEYLPLQAKMLAAQVKLNKLLQQSNYLKIDKSLPVSYYQPATHRQYPIRLLDYQKGT
ncbi:hypothetical protein HW132_31960 [Brasilonema sp. CT11]|nr:hypothetical protein [Brasilonema sp. CT11]